MKNMTTLADDNSSYDIPQTVPLTLKRFFTGSRNYPKIRHLIFRHFAYVTNTRQPEFRLESFRKYYYYY